MKKSHVIVLIAGVVIVIGGVIGLLVYQGGQERKALQTQLLAMQAAQAEAAERARKELELLRAQQAAEAEKSRLERAEQDKKQAAEAERARQDLEALRAQQAREAEQARLERAEQEKKLAAEAAQARLEREASDRRVATEAEFDRRLASVRDLKGRADQLATEANVHLRAFDKAPTSEAMRQFLATARRFFAEAKSMAKEFRDTAEFLSQATLPDATRKSLDDRLATLRGPVTQLEVRALRGQTLTEGIRARTVTVAANLEWQTTGLAAQRGEHIRLNPSGQWKWGTFTAKWTGPGGENAGLTYRLVNELNNAALLCRVGGGGIYPGWGGFAADRVGEVDFRINDTVVNDNQGEMKVEMWILPVELNPR